MTEHTAAWRTIGQVHRALTPTPAAATKAAGRRILMSHNTFGHLFRVTTFGESHGAAIGCVVDGCPPKIALEAADIQHDLDRRRPGQSRFTTQRQEPDQVKILSGVMTDDATGRQVTTGTPIALLIENIDQRSKDYSGIRDLYRPGHATTPTTPNTAYAIIAAARSSARETAARVAAGAIARKVVPGMTVRAALVAMGRTRSIGICGTGRNRPQPVLLPGCETSKILRDLSRRHPQSRLLHRRCHRGDRRRVAGGLGAPVYGKLDADIASA